MNNRSLLIFEKVLAILGILFFSSSLPRFMLPQIALTIIKYVIFFGALSLMSLKWETTLAVAKRAHLVWIVCGLSLISFVWSDAPSISSYDAREVLHMMVFGLYFASRFKLREQLSLVAFTLGGVALVSALLAIGMPSIGIDRTRFVGAWTGLYAHKNKLGKMMSLSVVAFSVLAADRQQQYIQRKYPWFALSGLFLSLGLVILSTSKTSLSVSVVSISLLYIWRFCQKQGNKRRLYVELAVLLSLVTGLVVANSWELLLASMGRGVTLSGRTEIWRVAFSELMDQNPLLGFGRGIFWLRGSATSLAVAAEFRGKYAPPHGHNGFLDLALDIGIIGLLCFLSSLIIAYKHALTRSFISKTAKDLWPLAFLSWITFYNFTESTLMDQINLFWPLYISAALCAKPTGRVMKLRLQQRYR